VAHFYNPSYSGGRDQEDHGLKPAWTNSLQEPILKISITKIELVELLKVKALNSNHCNPPPPQKKKKNSKEIDQRSW
jgi:hypothetical protein